MISFIKKLESDFNITIIKSREPIDFQNTYDLDSHGNITVLRLEEVNLKKIDIIFPISNSLVELSLVNCSLKNILSLKKFSCLKVLNLTNNFISNWSWLEEMNLLERLYISNTDISSQNDFKYFKNLKQLKTLDVSLNDEVISIKKLGSLKCLTYLNLSGTTIEHFEDVIGLEKLKKINLNACHDLDFSRLSSLQKFKDIRELDLSCCSISEIKEITSLKNLENLNLSSTEITKLDGIEELVHLRVLNIGHTSISTLQNLESLKKLKEIDFTNYLNESVSPLTEIKGLINLTNLEKLILTGHNIRALKNIPLDNIEYIDISYNNIESLEYNLFEKMRRPCLIKIKGNPIKIGDHEVPRHITIGI